jgi:tetratricopeptide (TPR) repeat protein
MSEYFVAAIDLYLNNDFYKYESTDENEYIEHLVTKMMEFLGNYYDTMDNETEETKTNTIKYYTLSIERGNVNSMFNLGHFYYECRDIKNMFKYYFMAIELRDIDTMYELAIYYQKKKDFDNMIKYYLMALEETENPNHRDIILNDGEKYFNLFILKEELEKIENKPPYLVKKLQNISVIPHIIVFENKKKLFTLLNHIVECGICYETKLNIDLYCGHCCCVDCYPKLYKLPCPYCRI